MDYWTSVTCPNCKRVIGYDNDDYKQIQALKCPYCKRWFYMAEAKIEAVPLPRKEHEI